MRSKKWEMKQHEAPHWTGKIKALEHQETLEQQKSLGTIFHPLQITAIVSELPRIEKEKPPLLLRSPVKPDDIVVLQKRKNPPAWRHGITWQH